MLHGSYGELMDINFYKDKRILITGHTGFKGTWLCRILMKAGADVMGYSLPPPTEPNLFSISGIGQSINSVIGDIRNLELLQKTITGFQPEIVIHMAAQSLVRTGYQMPVYTFETNALGTVNVLECVRLNPCVKSFLNVTTDKVYKNNEWEWGYRENEPLDGQDPYSNSKSCSEIITHCYKSSFFNDGRTAISTARAGNVIGGGDFAEDRIIPDCIRAASQNEPVIVRNPYSVRPYQHVLEPLFAYLMISQRQCINIRYSDYYNVGPDDSDCVTTGELTDLFCKKWGNGLTWENHFTGGPQEANFLKLDSSKLKSVFKWKPRWHVHDAVEKTVEWTKVWLNGGNVLACMDAQIKEYYGG